MVSETWTRVLSIGLAVTLIIAAILFVNVMINPTSHVTAQNAGNTGTFTNAQVVFTNLAANGSSAVLQNIGQSAHFLTYCNTGFSGTIDLEVSFTGSAPWTPIASATYGQLGITDSACHVLQAGGYFQNIRSTVSNYSAGSLSAWYSSSSGPIAFTPAALGSNGPTSPVACDKTGTQSFAQNTTGGNIVSGLPGAQIWVCQMTISFNGATTTGVIQLADGASGACSSLTTRWTENVLSSTQQSQTVGAPLGAFYHTTGGNTSLCFVSTAITASTTIAISYAQF